MQDRADSILKGNVDVEANDGLVTDDKFTVEKLLANMYGEHARPEYRRYFAEIHGADPEKANTVIDELLATGDSNHVLFTGEVLNHLGVSALGDPTYYKIQQALLSVMKDQNKEVADRAQAGRLLSRVGDPRQGVTVKTNGGSPLILTRGDRQHAVPDIEWVKVPNGSFRMGTEREEGWFTEKPAHDVDVNSFSISRYPVTNAQYRCFVDAGMYEDESFWQERLPEAAGQWLAGELLGETLFDSSALPEEPRKAYRKWLADDKERRCPMYFGDSHWNEANHPVIGVSWFEALAYSVWLNDITGAVGSSSVRLPTEKEWEYAARGNTGLQYAWGQEASPKFGNYKEAELERTTAVGLFAGSEAHDLYDLSGNVWEWTSSRWGDDFGQCAFEYGSDYLSNENAQNELDPIEFRIIRGGSWYNGADGCRCSVRVRALPNGRVNYVGFRVVCIE